MKSILNLPSRELLKNNVKTVGEISTNTRFFSKFQVGFFFLRIINLTCDLKNPISSLNNKIKTVFKIIIGVKLKSVGTLECVGICIMLRLYYIGVFSFKKL